MAFNDRPKRDYREPREKQGLYVRVIDNNITKAWRKFKRLCQDDGVLNTYREKQYYQKPSEKRNKAKAMAIARWKKKQKEIENNFQNFIPVGINKREDAIMGLRK